VAICSLGVFTLISTLLRFPYLYDLNQSTDPTWSVPNVVIWTIAELGSAITLCSVPTIRPLYAHLFQNPAKKRRNGSESGGTTEAVQRPPRRVVASFPFSIGSIGSIVDGSRWRRGDTASGSETELQSKAIAESSATESRSYDEEAEEGRVPGGSGGQPNNREVVD